jgi:hypothetical protein
MISGIKRIFSLVYAVIATVIFIVANVLKGTCVVTFILYLLYVAKAMYNLWINANSSLSANFILWGVAYSFIGFVLYKIAAFMYCVVFDYPVEGLKSTSSVNRKLYGIGCTISNNLPGRKNKIARSQGFRNYDEMKKYWDNNL